MTYVIKDDIDDFDNFDDCVEYTELEDEAFWEEIARGLGEEGFNSTTGEYFWKELSYYKIPTITNHFEYFEDE